MSERQEIWEREEEGCGGIIWEFRNLSTTSISTSAISMQMVEHVSDGKAMSRASFSVTLL